MAPVAQLIERLATDQEVLGSNPSRRTKILTMIKSLSIEKIFLVLFLIAIIASRLFAFYFYKDLNLEK